MVGMHWGYLFFFPGILVMIAVVVVGLVLLLVRVTSSPPHPFPTPPAPGAPGTRESPLDILARRFASGEISADEYQKARDLLQGGGPQQPAP